jgi:hypothetical protein
MLCDVLAFTNEYCCVMDADGDAVGEVIVNVPEPRIELSAEVIREATVVARQSPEMPSKLKSRLRVLIPTGEVGVAPGTVVIV